MNRARSSGFRTLGSGRVLGRNLPVGAEEHQKEQAGYEKSSMVQQRTVRRESGDAGDQGAEVFDLSADDRATQGCHENNFPALHLLQF
jgi:hypothetical protein